MSNNVRLTLIVCTYRRAAQVQKLLDCIASQTRVPEETLIVDASIDDETERVAQAIQAQNLIPDLRYFRVPPEDRGLTLQRNYGIAHAEGDLLAFLDDDTTPQSNYFAEILGCFQRHPEAVGVGGFINNEVQWRRTDGRRHSSYSVFRWGEWERREAYRWRLRKLLGLVSNLPPGWIPESGHGRPVGYLPPDGQDYKVEFMMGGSAMWRSKIFSQHRFSPYFEGYGLYEDLDFCIRASREGPLYLCTRAQLAHHQAPSGRPKHFRYGIMVVRNGWFVWRRRWPHPSWVSRIRWWAITILLTLCRLGDVLRGPSRAPSLFEAAGRVFGIITLLWNGAAHVGELDVDWSFRQSEIQP